MGVGLVCREVLLPHSFENKLHDKWLQDVGVGRQEPRCGACVGVWRHAGACFWHAREVASGPQVVSVSPSRCRGRTPPFISLSESTATFMGASNQSVPLETERFTVLRWGVMAGESLRRDSGSLAWPTQRCSEDPAATRRDRMGQWPLSPDSPLRALAHMHVHIQSEPRE